MLCQLPVFALQYCCLNFCGHGLLAVVSRFERLADAMAAEAKATAKAAAKPKAKGKAQAGSVCIFDAWSGCHFGVMKSSSFWLRYRRPLQYNYKATNNHLSSSTRSLNLHVFYFARLIGDDETYNDILFVFFEHLENTVKI